MPVIVSACLLGLPSRYDGKSISRPGLAEIAGRTVVPICPEQLGGLPTPRPAAEIVGGGGLDVLEGRARVVTRVDQVDVTGKFVNGAYAALHIARLVKPSLCILKAKSPSCGLAPNLGVAAALLLAHGFEVIEIE